MNGAARDGRGQSGTARDGAARMGRLRPVDGVTVIVQLLLGPLEARPQRGIVIRGRGRSGHGSRLADPQIDLSKFAKKPLRGNPLKR